MIMRHAVVEGYGKFVNQRLSNVPSKRTARGPVAGVIFISIENASAAAEIEPSTFGSEAELHEHCTEHALQPSVHSQAAPMPQVHEVWTRERYVREPGILLALQ